MRRTLILHSVLIATLFAWTGGCDDPDYKTRTTVSADPDENNDSNGDVDNNGPVVTNNGDHDGDNNGDVNNGDVNNGDINNGDVNNTKRPDEIPLDWKACTGDGDCVLVHLDCCGCAGYESVRPEYVEEAYELFAPSDCEDVPCDDEVCDPPQAACFDGVCGYAFEDPDSPCDGLDAQSCGGSPGCEPIWGDRLDGQQACGWAVDESEEEFIACRLPSPAPCPPVANLCLIEPGTGVPVIFDSSCPPDGWQTCESACTSSTCEELSPELCVERSDCWPLWGGDAVSACEGGLLDAAMLGCASDALNRCQPILTCAIHPETDAYFMFQTSCLPLGWQEISCGAVCIAERCEGLDQTACASTVGCLPLVGEPDTDDRVPTFFGCVDEVGCVATGDPECRRDPQSCEGWFFSGGCAPDGMLPCDQDCP